MSTLAPGTALHRRYPQLSQLPWLALGQWPTPLQRLDRLSEQLGAEIWVKREDLSAPRYGGNKVRKLEPLLAAAAQQGAASLLTVGGIGSHHVLATAIHGQQAGLPTRAVVVPQPLTGAVRQNTVRLQALGVELLPCPARPLVPLALHQAHRTYKNSYVIGPGGSTALGTLGYVAAALELDEQLGEQDLPRPDALFIALGSGGSLAGLALGLGLARWCPLLLGVRVVESLYCNRPWLSYLRQQTSRLLAELGLGSLPQPCSYKIIKDYIGKGYGHPTPRAKAAQALAAEAAQLQLETTYTAKAFAALLDYAKGAGRGQRLLFWQTYNSRDLGWLDASGPKLALPQRISDWLDQPRSPGRTTR